MARLPCRLLLLRLVPLILPLPYSLCFATLLGSIFPSFKRTEAARMFGCGTYCMWQEGPARSGSPFWASFAPMDRCSSPLLDKLSCRHPRWCRGRPGPASPTGLRLNQLNQLSQLLALTAVGGHCSQVHRTSFMSESYHYQALIIRHRAHSDGASFIFRGMTRRGGVMNGYIFVMPIFPVRSRERESAAGPEPEDTAFQEVLPRLSRNDRPTSCHSSPRLAEDTRWLG